VVDEEQRFGVEHKEHIKSMRTHVDVLTMSATPIPRTLEMSLAGIREDVDDPDPARGALSGAHIRRATRRQADSRPRCRREMLRDGQAFYIHNRVRSIDQARRAVCGAWCRRPALPSRHGQMPEDILERTVEGF